MGKCLDDIDLDELDALARKAFGDAAKATLAAGLPVTGVRDGEIVRTYPDGAEERLGPIDLTFGRDPAEAKASLLRRTKSAA